MAGTKRSAEGTGATTRSAKVAKKDGASPKNVGKGGKKGPKANLASSAFLSKALPITVNITNTPPTIPNEDNVPAAPADPGHIGGVKILATQFATGSYGWKGNKRVTIEVPNEAGEMEKLQVQVTINATVLGSKNAPEDEPANGEDEEKEEDKEEEKAEEAAEDVDAEEEKAE